MAVPGKKMYRVYLTEEYVEGVRGILEKGKYKGGLSGYFDDILKNSYETVKSAGLMKQAPVTKAKLLRLVIQGWKKQ